MDYIATGVALRAIADAVTADVLPHVTDAYARSQLWAAAGLLSNIAVELDADGAAPNGAAPDGSTHSHLLEVEGLLGRQVSLHYRKAVTGAEA
ncbi:hypothetical protein GIS00_09625 [Nakamurella sp. YIM 132087]|uniref:Uncharacterized protein n=1 Tax=Nakamurella alba TaxID=2665158 RepID=A0A7K1FN48_9ACTN|nr:hypothetical protein [Nakamurella alba]MTD14204.1 hypothetical protein [Nakamurella alba]